MTSGNARYNNVTILVVANVFGSLFSLHFFIEVFIEHSMLCHVHIPGTCVNTSSGCGSKLLCISEMDCVVFYIPA